MPLLQFLCTYIGQSEVVPVCTGIVVPVILIVISPLILQLTSLPKTYVVVLPFGHSLEKSNSIPQVVNCGSFNDLNLIILPLETQELILSQIKLNNIIIDNNNIQIQNFIDIFIIFFLFANNWQKQRNSSTAFFNLSA